ncbi:MAG: hypothetical protein RLZZ252_428 [Bacteroidota bacterium]|jgi:glycosyltransferase involved in cell wall biosynthesis
MGLVLTNSLVALLYILWWRNTLKSTYYFRDVSLIDEAIDRQNPTFQSHPYNSSNFKNCSILIPFRNEANRIQPLLQSLNNINSAVEWEVIFIDDFSTDNSSRIIQTWIQTNSHISATLISSSLPSKKQALLTGALQANYDWILTTDADCQLPATLINSHANTANANPNAKCIIGRVEFYSSNSSITLLNTYETLENQVLVAIGLSAAQHTAPIAANGANLCFHKSTWLSLGDISSHKHIASGDDIFTTQLFFNKNASWVVVNNFKDGVVKAQLCASVSQFFHQRVRWFKKSFLQKSQKTLFQQSFFGFYLVTLWVLTVIPVYGEYALLAFIPIPTKIAIDIWFGNKLFNYHQYPTKIGWIGVSSVCQTIFLPLLGFAAPFLSFQWKTRKISK